MFGFPFTPIISFVFSFFIVSILDFLADFHNTSISVDKILFISLVGICHTFAQYIKILENSNYLAEKNYIMRNLRVYCSPNATQVIQVRKMKWAGKVACKGPRSKS
jgi:hypothetical protein